MSRYTLDEDAVIRLMYEDGEDWKDIADTLKRPRAGVATRYKLILKSLQDQLEDNIKNNLEYHLEGDNFIPAKDWAAQQVVRVSATWQREGLPPSSLYAELPPWPESIPKASDKSGGQEPTISQTQPPPPPASSTDDESEEATVESLQKELLESNEIHIAVNKRLQADYKRETGRLEDVVNHLLQEKEALIKANQELSRKNAEQEKSIDSLESQLEEANGRNVKASIILSDMRETIGALDRATDDACDAISGTTRPENL